MWGILCTLALLVAMFVAPPPQLAAQAPSPTSPFQVDEAASTRFAAGRVTVAVSLDTIPLSVYWRTLQQSEHPAAPTAVIRTAQHLSLILQTQDEVSRAIVANGGIVLGRSFLLINRLVVEIDRDAIDHVWAIPHVTEVFSIPESEANPVGNDRVTDPPASE